MFSCFDCSDVSREKQIVDASWLGCFREHDTFDSSGLSSALKPNEFFGLLGRLPAVLYSADVGLVVIAQPLNILAADDGPAEGNVFSISKSRGLLST